MDLSGVIASITGNQSRQRNDYYDADGFLVCGKCGTRKEIYLPFLDQKVPVMCHCRQEQLLAEEAAEREKRKLLKIEDNKNRSMMNSRYADLRFGNFTVNEYNAKPMAICKRYAEKFSDFAVRNYGILMWGDVGTGKSHTAACIANYLLDQGYSVLMASIAELLRIMSMGDAESQALMHRIDSDDLVIFDDLGTERKTDYGLERLYDLIDGRYRSKRPMIVTTNQTFVSMKEEVDPRYARINDRIFEVCYPVQFVGPSWRKKIFNDKFKAFMEIVDE